LRGIASSTLAHPSPPTSRKSFALLILSPPSSIHPVAVQVREFESESNGRERGTNKHYERNDGHRKIDDEIHREAGRNRGSERVSREAEHSASQFWFRPLVVHFYHRSPPPPSRNLCRFSSERTRHHVDAERAANEKEMRAPRTGTTTSGPPVRRAPSIPSPPAAANKHAISRPLREEWRGSAAVTAVAAAAPPPKMNKAPGKIAPRANRKELAARMPSPQNQTWLSTHPTRLDTDSP
jgi:hypothetical protein